MPSCEPQTLAERVRALSLELGFARVGFARAEHLEGDERHLREWLARGYHGSMSFLERNVEVRADPRDSNMVEGARSVVVVAAAYGARTPHAHEPGRIARYAQGRDYHPQLYARVRAITRLLREQGFAARASVDTMPVLERAWAQRAGIGFVGKNCMLIVPGLGSYVFLAAIVTSAELPPDAPMRERCGQCTLCLEACPTRAFAAPRVLDARRCISYLTIEHEGAIDPELRPAIGDWLFGCDVCQEVCPFNRSASEHGDPALAPSTRTEELAAEELLRFDDSTFTQLVQGSALRRAGRAGLARNAAVVLGNARDKRSLPVLQHAAQHDDDATVRDAAAWAVERMRDDGEA